MAHTHIYTTNETSHRQTRSNSSVPVQRSANLHVPKVAKESKTEKTLEGNERYRRICRKLKDLVVRVQLRFLESLEPVFNRFLTLLPKKKEPLIHMQLSKLVRTLMQHFLKSDEVGKKIRCLQVREPTA